MTKQILITTTYFHPYLSGLTLYPERLAKRWLKEGYKVKVLTYKHDPALPDRENFQGIDIVRISPHFSMSKGLVNLAYPKYAWSHIKEADYVLVNLPAATENLWNSVIAKILGKKAVVLYHCDLNLKDTLFDLLASRLTNLSSMFSCFLADRIITSSKDYADTSVVIKPFLKKTVYNLPTVELPKPSLEYNRKLKRFYGKHTPVIGFVGRVSREKNLEVLIKALDLLLPKYPKLKFLMVGPYAFQVIGETKYYLKVLKHLEGLGADYEMLGVLKKEELASFFKYIDILVLPSNNRTESFGMSQVEAMLHGTPVVTADFPGIRVPLKLSRMGELFDSSSPKDLANKIDKVLTHRKKYLVNYSKLAKIFLEEKPLLP